jgi:uncharacterized protein YcfJ
MSTRQRRYPSGRPPWDTVNGARVGALAGALSGVVLTALVSTATPWFMLGGGIVGGFVGYRIQKRKQRMP